MRKHEMEVRKKEIKRLWKEAEDAYFHYDHTQDGTKCEEHGGDCRPALHLDWLAVVDVLGLANHEIRCLGDLELRIGSEEEDLYALAKLHAGV